MRLTESVQFDYAEIWTWTSWMERVNHTTYTTYRCALQPFSNKDCKILAPTELRSHLFGDTHRKKLNRRKLDVGGIRLH